jgi:hypothetical protein
MRSNAGLFRRMERNLDQMMKATMPKAAAREAAEKPAMVIERRPVTLTYTIREAAQR